MRIESLLLLLFTPLWTTVFHALACRMAWARARPRQTVAAGIGLFTASLVAGLITWRDGGGSAELLFSLFGGALLAHIYFHIFNMSETARRIRLLIEIKEGSETPLAETYTPENMISIRLARLRELKQADWVEGRYFARNSWLLWTALAIHSHERLLFPARFSLKK